MPTPSVRLPPPLPAPATGDPALDALLVEAFATAAEGGGVEAEPFEGRGAALAACLTPELFDRGATVWDDQAFHALPIAERSALKAAAGLAYRQASARRFLREVLVREIAASPQGRVALRAALARGRDWPDAIHLAAALAVDGSPEDLQAVIEAIPENEPHPDGVHGAQARLALDPAWGAHLLEGPDTDPSVAACALIAAHRLLPPEATPDRRWQELALRVLGSAAFAQFGAAILARVPPGPELLRALLRDPPRTREHAVLLARHDDPAAFPALVAFVADSSMGDSPILQALERSAHPEAAHAALAMVAALEAAQAPGPRLKRYSALAKALGARFGVKPPRKAKAAAPAPRPEPPPPAPPAPPPRAPNLPPFAELDASLTRAFEQAGLAAHLDALRAPAAALVLERADLASFAIGATRFGGPPDLPASTPWPAVKRVPMSFVGQIDLAQVAGLPFADRFAPLPTSGLLSFFVHDADPEDHGQRGAVLFTDAGAQRVRREAPSRGRAPSPACRVALVPTLRLAHPTHPAVTRGLTPPEAQAYQALRAAFDLPRASFLLGHRDRYDGGVKRGHRLLLLVTSDPQADFRWGDEDELAFFLEERALAAGDFTRVEARVGE